VRDIPELKDVLIKSEKIGGVGMSEEVFGRLYDLLVDKKLEIKKENIDLSKIIAEYESSQKQEVTPVIAKEEEIDVRTMPVKPIFPKEKITGTEAAIDQLLKEKGIAYAELAEKEEIKRELGGMKRVPEAGGEIAKQILEKEEFLEQNPEIMPPAQNKSQTQSSPVTVGASPLPQAQVQTEIKQPLLQKAVPEARPRVEDVKFTPKLIGPIDELANMKIEDFRRLAKEPEIAVQKILAKLELLEGESIVKKNQGVSALKTSPLYKAYAEIMNKAIKEGKSFNQAITENPIMSVSEFKAIMDLNKSLKY